MIKNIEKKYDNNKKKLYYISITNITLVLNNKINNNKDKKFLVKFNYIYQIF